MPDCSLGLYVDFLWSESSLVGQFYWNKFTTLSCSPIIRVAVSANAGLDFLGERLLAWENWEEKKIYRN